MEKYEEISAKNKSEAGNGALENFVCFTGRLHGLSGVFLALDDSRVCFSRRLRREERRKHAVAIQSLKENGSVFYQDFLNGIDKIKSNF